MYLTQSVQTYAGAVPLVKDRDGFLRVFVTATPVEPGRALGPACVSPSPAS